MLKGGMPWGGRVQVLVYNAREEFKDERQGPFSREARFIDVPNESAHSGRNVSMAKSELHPRRLGGHPFE